MEGPLMKLIRLALYNQPNQHQHKHQKMIKFKQPCINNILYIKLNTFLNRTYYIKYYTLFRQFNTFYDNMLYLIKTVIPNVIKTKNIKIEYKQYISNINLINLGLRTEKCLDLLEDNIPCNEITSDLDKFNTLIKSIINEMEKKKIIINNNNDDKENILYDFIHNINFLNDFYIYLQ